MVNTLLDKIAHWYFSKDALPYWCIIIFDSLVILFTSLFCFTIDEGIYYTYENLGQVFLTLSSYLLYYIVSFRIFRTYSGIIRYTSFSDIHRIIFANLTGTVLTAVTTRFLNFGFFFIPLGLKTLGEIFLLATVIMWSTRLLVKYVYEFYRDDRNAKHAFIYGVKNGGLNIARAITSGEKPQYKLKGFFSDADDMPGKTLMGIKVFKNDEHIIERMKEYKAEVLFVSPLKQEAFVKNPEMIDRLIEAGIKIFTMNTSSEWDGKDNIKVSQLKEVSIEDLLPREEIQINIKDLETHISGYTIMITGAAGSIGFELVKQIAQLKPQELILIDQAETPMHDVRLMLEKQWPELKAETIVTTICNKKRMEAVFSKYKPEYVFHTAAYKHVPMMEDNPSASVYNNVYGTKIIADLSVKYFVKKFVMVSTDKAVNPTNVMGCSKRICEIYVQSLDKAIKDGRIMGITQFVTTRFGNVLGSNGSVIPLFKEQIKNGGPVTVTDPNIIRYFMLISEACKLVMEAGTKGRGGEIFVFDMGKPVKIADLANRMILLSRAQNVKIQFTGLRPGEKLYEEMLNKAETTMPSFHEKIRIAKVREYDYKDVSCKIDNLISVSQRFNDMNTVKIMKQIVPEYKSRNSIYEQLDNAI